MSDPDLTPQSLILSPAFIRLTRQRRIIVYLLTSLLLLVFLGNLLLLSIWSDIAILKIQPDAVLNLAIYYSVFLLILSVICAVFYTWYANRKIDPLRTDVLSTLPIKLDES